MSTSRFFAGAVIGLVAGMLMAPKKGEELRNDLAESADQWKAKLDKLTGKAGPQIDDLRHLLSDEIGGLHNDVRDRINKMLDESAEAAKNVKQDAKAEMAK